MNRIWIYLWIVLLICQVVTVWISRQIVSELDLPSAYLTPEVIDLANRTNQLWPTEEMDGSELISDANTSRNESLLARESLILQLQRLQSELISQGVELEVVQELQAYLGTLDGSESIPILNAYIQGIIDWIQPNVGISSDCLLERVNLHPDAHSDLPALAFEMSGVPVSMGEQLLGSVSGSGLWRLNELDLLLPEQQGRCWMRGSYVFSSHQEP
jgi:hypothetical protein